MSTMIETVAKAICMSRTCEGFMCCQHPAQRSRRATGCPVKIGGYDDAARAAIEAMREPTPEMVAAVEDTGIDGYYDYFDPSIPYRAMISAALSGDA